MDFNDSSCTFVGAFTRQEADAELMDIRLVFFLFALPIFTGCLGNVTLLILVAFNRRVKTKPTLFLISIMAADLILSLVCGINHLDKYHSFLRLNESVAPVLCRLTSYAELAVQIVLVFSLLAVSVERFVVVCFPLQAKHVWTRRRCRIVIVCVWLSAMLVGMIEPLTRETTCIRFTITDENDREQKDFLCAYSQVMGSRTRQIVTWLRLCILFAFPFAVMLVFYGAVIYRLWRSSEASMPAGNVGARRFTRHQSDLPLPRRGSSTVTSASLATNKRQMSETFFFHRTTTKSRLVSTSALSTISTTSVLSFASSLISMISPVGSASTDTLSNQNEATSSKNAFVTPAVEFVARRQMAVEVRRSRKRVMKTLILVLALFVLSWGPKLIIEVMIAQNSATLEIDRNVTMNLDFFDHEESNSTQFVENYDSDTDTEFSSLEQARTYAISIMLFHSTFNPILYIVFSSDFRAMLCFRKGRMRT